MQHCGAQCAAILLFIAACCAVFPAHAHVSSLERHAHQEGYSYSSFSFGANRIDALYTLPAELASTRSREEFSQRVLAEIAIYNEGERCPARLEDSVDYSAISAWQFEVSYRCGTPFTIDIDYELFSEIPFHTNHVELWIGPHVSYAEIGSMAPSLTVPIDQILWEQQFTLPPEPAPLKGKAPRTRDYFTMGFTHVLTGYDHIVFLLGLLLIVHRLRTLVVLITSFTIAHSITLGLSGLDIATFPVGLTEALIAGTIIYIGGENIWYLARERAKGSLQRRWIVTFIFGLIHGFGFSYLLREIGLPPDDFLVALLLFNLGVEAAQLAVVVLPFMAVKFVAERLPLWPRIAMVLSIAILLIGCYWLFERAFPFPIVL